MQLSRREQQTEAVKQPPLFYPQPVFYQQPMTYSQNPPQQWAPPVRKKGKGLAVASGTYKYVM
jgi:hypothetical protein